MVSLQSFLIGAVSILTYRSKSPTNFKLYSCKDDDKIIYSSDQGRLNSFKHLKIVLNISANKVSISTLLICVQKLTETIRAKKSFEQLSAQIVCSVKVR